MTKKETKIIVSIIVIAIIVLVVIAVRNRKEEPVEENPVVQNEPPKEEFVQTLEDGTRLNTSNKLQETKKVEGLEIKDFQLTARNNETQLLGTITNTSNSTQGNFLANVKVIDKQGKELVTVQVLIPEIKAGESTPLISSANFDYANAYDFSISRVK